MTTAIPLPVDLTCTPFLKFVGGKRWLLAEHPHLLPPASSVRRYFEIFLGGGAVFFGRYAGVRPAILNDAEGRLVDVYRVVRDDVEALIETIARPVSVLPRYAFEVARALLNTRDGSPVERAVAFLRVNRWGYNGLWRVNREGGCNTPCGLIEGHEPPALGDPDVLRACSRALQGVELHTGDFEGRLVGIGRGDFVFADPPYRPVSETASFVGYAAGGFSYDTPAQQSLFEPPPRSDHDRLLDALRRIHQAGARFTLTNSETARELYEGKGWTIERVEARRSINSDAEKRGEVGEIVVRNW